jgi:hypothetical protein
MPLNPFPHVPLPQGLAFEFIGTFARYEYALKESGFAKGGAEQVSANWDAFSVAIDWHFRRVADLEFRAAVVFLLAEPPRKQVLKDGRVAWKESPANLASPKAQQVLLMVRRIRNNMFHGAKVWSPERGNGDRDIKLVDAGLKILKGCVTLNAEVNSNFRFGRF